MKGARKYEGEKRKGEWKVKLVGKNNTHRSSAVATDRPTDRRRLQRGGGGGIAHAASEKTFLLPSSPLSPSSARPSDRPDISHSSQRANHTWTFIAPKRTSAPAAEQTNKRTNGVDGKPKHGSFARPPARPTVRPIVFFSGRSTPSSFSPSSLPPHPLPLSAAFARLLAMLLNGLKRKSCR